MKSVILLGSGISLKDGINTGLWDKIKDGEKWSCNSIFNIMPYLPNKQVWVDISFFDKNEEKLWKLQSEGVNLVAKRFTNRKKYMGLLQESTIIQYETTRESEKYYGKEAIIKGLIYYGMMGLCGTFALSLAIALGYDQIYLCGYDFGNSTLSDKVTHIYSEEELLKFDMCCTGAFRPSVYRLPGDELKREISDYDPFSIEKDIKIWNVSLKSNIYQFPRISYDTFYGMIGVKSD